MTIIKGIHESLLNRGKIFKKEEILHLFEEYKKLLHSSAHKKVIEYLSKHKYIKRVFLGYYYVNSYDERERNFCNYMDKELVFLVLNKEKIKWYVGLNTAIYEQGKTWQTPNMISIINTRLSGKRKIVGLKVRFLKIRDDLIFGLKEKETDHHVRYFYSDPAKTYIDMVYFKDVKHLTSVKNTKEYLKRYPKWVGKK